MIACLAKGPSRLRGLRSGIVKGLVFLVGSIGILHQGREVRLRRGSLMASAILRGGMASGGFLVSSVAWGHDSGRCVTSGENVQIREHVAEAACAADNQAWTHRLYSSVEWTQHVDLIPIQDMAGIVGVGAVGVAVIYAGVAIARKLMRDISKGM